MSQCTASDSEEEVFVYVELGDDVEIENFKNINVLGVNTKNPIVQMDDTVFTGKYDNAFGTYMFFKDVPPPQTADPCFEKAPEKNLEYLCKTRKLIKMEHAYITPNNREKNIGNGSQSSNVIEPVHFNTYEEAIGKFKSYWESIKSEEDVTPEIKDSN